MLFNPKWEQKVTIAPWRQVLLDAADYIETHGWARGISQQGSAVCALEAIGRCNDNGRDAAWHLSRLVGPPNGELVIHRCYVVTWNDRPGQTKANVVATMRAVARQGE